jgi:hypothetical protein
MDPITTAIVAALAAGAASGATEIGKQALVDAYGALKAALKKKFGPDSDLADAMHKLEQKPDSAGRKALLQEEVAASQADQDADLLAAAQALLEQIKTRPGGEQHIQQATGSYIAQADRGGTATVTVTPDRAKD